MNLGAKVTPLNPFIENYYKKLKGEELEDAWMMAISSIKTNKDIITTINKQIDSEKDMNQEKKIIYLILSKI